MPSIAFAYPSPFPLLHLSFFSTQSISLHQVRHPILLPSMLSREQLAILLRNEDGAHREAWSQVADMLDGDNDRDDERSAWIADVLVAGLKIDHADKLGQSLLSPIYGTDCVI
jgi:hypothetical protein